MPRLAVALAVLLVTTPAFAQQPPAWTYEARGDGVHLRIFRDYHLAAGDMSPEPIVVIGGTATIDGRTGDEVIVIGGALRVGPSAVIGGDVVSIGGTTTIDPKAQVQGGVNETVIAWPTFDARWWAAAAMAANVLRLGFALLMALVVAILVPYRVRDIAFQGPSAPAAAAVGLGTQIFFIPALVALSTALVISVIGVPLLLLLPFLVFGAGVVWVAGFTAIAARAGAALRGSRMPATAGLLHEPYPASSSGSTVVDVLVGFVAVSGLTVLAHLVSLAGPPAWRAALWIGGVGLLVEYVAWTIGLGAGVVMLLGGRRRDEAPPALPLTAPAPSTV